MFAPLPIYDVLNDVRKALGQGSAAILQAPPGAGKSTILPLELMHEPWLKGKKILMLEPRKLAARGVAGRMANLLGETVGERVGFRVRFETKVGTKTQIEVVTEGILTRMLQQDNSLENTGLVIFDEFHERSLHTDLALVLCRQIQEILREDLKILVMSATLDTSAISGILNNATIITSDGRQHPLNYHYVPHEQDRPIPAIVAQIVQRAFRENEGDILAFLPGAGEIQTTAAILAERLPDACIHMLFGDLSFKEQEAAILPNPSGKRKVILSSSIAETSLTIEGIKVVVDSGLMRIPRFDTRSGLTRLETVTVTRDTADQRAGRAGRMGPGVCYRLWSEGLHGQIQAQRQPEILSADLSSMVLELAHWGIHDPISLKWLTSPQAGAVKQAQILLTDLGSLKDCKITDRGKAMLRLPTHPRIAHLLLEAQEWGIASLAADVAAILEERDPLPREAGADLTLRVEALQQWRAGLSVNADHRILERVERLSLAWRKILGVHASTSSSDHFAIGGLIAAAYPERIGKQMEKGKASYKLSNGRKAALPMHDSLSHETWLAVAHLDAGLNEGKIFLAAPVSPEDLADLATTEEILNWNAREGVLVAQLQKQVGGLILTTQPLKNIPETKVISVLLKAIQADPSLLPMNENVVNWQARVMSLRNWRPDELWPDVRLSALLESAAVWLSPALSGIRNRTDLHRLDLLKLLSCLLPWPLPQHLNELAPQAITVPTGSKIQLEYKDDGSSPVLSVRVQEMFGLLETPTINGRKTKVVLHLLSPAYRPVQVTQDLRSFWENTYPEVRKDLRGRYPKHHWPENPSTAEAMRGPKRRF